MDKDYEQGIRDFLSSIPEPEGEPATCSTSPTKFAPGADLSLESSGLYIEREDGPEFVGRLGDRWSDIASATSNPRVIPSGLYETTAQAVTADAFSVTTYSIQDIIDAIERLGGTIRPS